MSAQKFDDTTKMAHFQKISKKNQQKFNLEESSVCKASWKNCPSLVKSPNYVVFLSNLPRTKNFGHSNSSMTQIQNSTAKTVVAQVEPIYAANPCVMT